LTPVLVLITGCFLDATDREIPRARAGPPSVLSRAGRDLLWTASGLGAVAVLHMAWIVLFDDPAGWYRQTIAWPAQHRHGSLGLPELRQLWGMLGVVRLGPVLAAAAAGCIACMFRGRRGLTVLVAMAIGAELVRAAAEGAPWPYLLTVGDAVVLRQDAGAVFARAASSFLGRPSSVCRYSPECRGLNGPRSVLRIGICQTRRQLPRNAQRRISAGESLFVWSTIISSTFCSTLSAASGSSASFPPCLGQERISTRQYYERHGPIGGPADNGSPRWNGSYWGRERLSRCGPGCLHVDPGSRRPGSQLSPMLPVSAQYREVVNTGLLSAWRLAGKPEPIQPESR
jgi:hypothetical protein